MYLPKRLEHFYQALSEVIIAFKNADIRSASLYTERVTTAIFISFSLGWPFWHLIIFYTLTSDSKETASLFDWWIYTFS